VHQATIYENITMGNDVSSTDLQAAIKAACLDQDLRMLPLGVHTETDTLGRNLTASIRKRIVLARALLNKPSLVVINGLIDSVDYRLQVSIMNALNSLEDTTIIHVTGDPVVIQACERAIVIDNGSVVNDGNANDLLSSDEFLKTLLAN
jgi:ABC-type multidrug transport system fused ATPase/permease subunit